MTLSTEDWTAAQLLGGKSAADLQTGLTVGANSITGTLKYVTGYTQFSGDVDEQSGNYMVVKVTSDEGATITAGVRAPLPTLDSDGIIICRITDKTTEKFTVNATKGGVTTTKEFDLSGLTLTPAPEPGL